MLKLDKINKYFYKNKQNQIHVIDNTSIEFEDKGLVALLGPSGSGKTTLLNVIGGLDKWNSGTLIINGKKYKRRNFNKLNKIRNINIGYIFQDYKIIDDMTVFDNVALSLKMIGIKDKKVIKERVDYVLTVLELYRYRNRYVANMSGGERQRVGIARAIAKNPDIVICDEPTGNLDSKNSIEIMNIIKAISKNRLVILVTHEIELANFYADRILEVSDGKIVSDKINDKISELDYQLDNKIYLKDFENHLVFKEDGNEINYYFNGQEKNKINIVIRNGNLYIDSKYNVEVINEDSKYELVNEHYKKIDKSIYEKYEFKMEDYQKKDTSIVSIFTSIKNAIIKSRNVKGVKKALYVAHFITGIFIIFTVSCILGVQVEDKSNYATSHDTYVEVIMPGDDTNVDIYNKILESNPNYIIPSYIGIELMFDVTDFYQSMGIPSRLGVEVAYTSIIQDSDLIYGRMPENDNEIILDKLIFDRSLKLGDSSLKSIGISEVSEIIGRKVTMGESVFTIVGITDQETPVVYIDSEVYHRLNDRSISFDKAQLENIDYYQSPIVLKKGKMPEVGEIIIPYDLRYEIPLNKIIKYDDLSLKVVGYFESDDLSTYLINGITYNDIELKRARFLVVSTNDKNTLIKNLNNYEKSLVPKDINEEAYKEYKVSRQETVKSYVILCSILLGVTLVEIYFMSRSSFLSRIKEVGILRAIGVRKMDIYKMFMGDILYTTIKYGFVGIIFGYLIIDAISGIFDFSGIFIINIPIMLFCMLIILLFNILVGLYPVKRVIRKTPAEILARKDI